MSNQANWKLYGGDLITRRTRAGNTITEEAKVRGVTYEELQAAERGEIDPDPILQTKMKFTKSTITRWIPVR